MSIFIVYPGYGWDGGFDIYGNTHDVAYVAPASTCPNGRKSGETWTVECSEFKASSGFNPAGAHRCKQRCNSNGSLTTYITQCDTGCTGKGKAFQDGTGYTSCKCTQSSSSTDYNSGNGDNYTSQPAAGTSQVPQETPPVVDNTAQYLREDEISRRHQLCVNNFGEWDTKSKICMCNTKNNFRFNEYSGKCECATDYELVSDKCVRTKSAQRREICKKLEETEGQPLWDSAQEECVCTDAHYDFKVDKCVIKPDIDACLKAQGTQWDETINQCVCTVNNDDGKMEFKNGTCQQKASVELCAKISDAKWFKGACVCLTDGYVIDEINEKCVESDDTREKRVATEKAAERKKLQDESRPRIAEIKSRIDGYKSDLRKSVSVWKDKNGNFNTARLASDSIAGVVLGTAGGLITSHVIKKNQIKGGFEDIKCSIGGQVVASYGDEFQVGMQ